MIKLTLEVTPGTCNLLLASLAETQMQPPQPEAEVLDKES